jgi:hypothetical protein
VDIASRRTVKQGGADLFFQLADGDANGGRGAVNALRGFLQRTSSATATSI